MSKDYLAMRQREPGDKVDYGVRGMRWGVRRSTSQLKAAAATRATETEAKPSVKPSGSETSAARYDRLKAEAKSGRGNQMDDADLKFFNARTEALSKVNKLNQTDPGWLSRTTKKVLQTSAERTMQSVSDAVATKYITVPITDAIGKKPKKD